MRTPTGPQVDGLSSHGKGCRNMGISRNGELRQVVLGVCAPPSGVSLQEALCSADMDRQ